MEQLNIPKSQNSEETARLIKSKRELLKRSQKKTRGRDFSLRAVAKRVGISTTHLVRLEYGERELSIIDVIYGISRELNIPLNQLIKTYLGLSSEEEKRCFYIDSRIFYGMNNGQIIEDASVEFLEKHRYKATEQRIAAEIGCSKAHFNRCKRGGRKFKDIRLLYGLSRMFDVPLYVFIRNELEITDDEIAKVIDLHNYN